MRADGNAALPQVLQAKAARNAQGRGQAAGKMSAARGILRALPLDLRRIVRMGGPRHVREGRVVGAARVRVADDRRQRRAAGMATGEPRKELRPVRLAAGRRMRALSRRAPRQKSVQFVKIGRKARREALHAHADGGRVGLPENGDPQSGPEAAAHRSTSFVIFR